MKHSHYFKDVAHLSTIDVYRVLLLFQVVNPCLQHAAKKILAAGGRGGGKNIERDIQEAIDSLERWKAMAREDGLLPVMNELPQFPEADALMDSIDPVGVAFEWFDAVRRDVTDEWAFKSIVRHLLKALESKVAPVPLSLEIVHRNHQEGEERA